MLYELTMFLIFIVILIITHYVFKNIKDIMLWSCKLITAAYIWLIIWIATQIHHLPEWQASFSTSAAKLFELVNITKRFDL